MRKFNQVIQLDALLAAAEQFMDDEAAGKPGRAARERFDRMLTAEGCLRHRMVSGLTALGAEDSHGDRAKWSYLLLADELRRRSARSAEDLEELFRRMVFNALISNTDDHPRNHALIATTTQ